MGLKDRIQVFGLLMVLKVLYAQLLRPLIKRAIDDPDEEWDDFAMEIFDRLFNYQGDE